MQDKNTKYISIIWHELRTPLTSIRGYLSMILEWDMWEISYEARKALNNAKTVMIAPLDSSNLQMIFWCCQK